MPTRRRPADVAREALGTLAKYQLPINVRDICRQHAFVVRRRLEDELSGALYPNEGMSKPWTILVNSAHSLERQQFTMAHELGHLLLEHFKTPHADGTNKILFRDEKSSLGTEIEEVEANQFAAELLLPADLLLPKLREIGIATWDDDAPADLLEKLEELAHRCRVSKQALLIRIGSLMARS